MKETLKQWEYKNQTYLRIVDYFNLNDKKKLSILECLIEEETAAILRLHSCNDIIEAAQKFELYGGVENSKGNLHRELEQLKQNDKTLAKFIEEVKWILLKYNCEDEELLVEYVIEGMKSSKAQYEIKRKGVKDINEIITIEREISKIECAQQRKRKITEINIVDEDNSDEYPAKPNSFDINQIKYHRVQEPPRNFNSNYSKKRCFICGQDTHLQRNCPNNKSHNLFSNNQVYQKAEKDSYLPQKVQTPSVNYWEGGMTRGPLPNFTECFTPKRRPNQNITK